MLSEVGYVDGGCDRQFLSIVATHAVLGSGVLSGRLVATLAVKARLKV